MSDSTRSPEYVWLKEAKRRIDQGLPLNQREMLITLRDQLPLGFVPKDLDYSLVTTSGPTLLGLRTLGDSEGLLELVESTLMWIRGRLIEELNRVAVGAEEVADALEIDLPVAQRMLWLIGTLNGFSTGATMAGEHGYAQLQVDRIEVLAKYLAFQSLDSVLDERADEVSRFAPASAIVVDQAEVSDVFVLMNMNPDDPHLDDVLDGIKTACAEFGLRAKRIDDEEHSGRITDRIIDLIRSSHLIIADLSGERPNVYYEVGFAHALDKRPILYRRTGTPLHFDLAVHNVPEYRNVGELRSMLRNRLEAVLGRSPASAAT